MIEGVIEKIRLYTRLAKLFDDAREYAQVKAVMAWVTWTNLRQRVCNEIDMIRKIRAESKSDPELKRLLDNAGECAEMYLLARKTQTGCDGTGEVVTMTWEVSYGKHC